MDPYRLRRKVSWRRGRGQGRSQPGKNSPLTAIAGGESGGLGRVQQALEEPTARTRLGQELDVLKVADCTLRRAILIWNQKRSNGTNA